PGTVTFLFTDIEGSTHLLKRLGASYGDVLAEHRRILRAAAHHHAGEEVDNQGDSFLFAFPRADAAAGAAIDAQRALATHEWPEGIELRVRMGIHSSEPSASDEGYYGLGVHRAARIMAAAHGGQVLVSFAASSLPGEGERDAGRLRELGEVWLKALARPERVYQLEAAGLREASPPVGGERRAPALGPALDYDDELLERDDALAALAESFEDLASTGRGRLVRGPGGAGGGETTPFRPLVADPARAVP